MSRIVILAIGALGLLAGCANAPQPQGASVPPPAPQPTLAVSTIGAHPAGNALYLQSREFVVRAPLGTQMVALDESVQTSGPTMPVTPPASCPPIDLTPRR
jgi:hypothetical protein